MHEANKKFIGGTLIGLAAFIGGFEGIVNTTYKDPIGVLTICAGHTGKHAKPGNKMSNEQCLALLDEEAGEFRDKIVRAVNKPMAPQHVIAFTSFAFNVGTSGAASSRAIRLFNQGNYKEACRALAYSPSGSPAWSYAGGKYFKGLHTRRIAEMNMCYEGNNELGY